jgi:polysaccharide biosynthesis protein PslH
MNKKPTVVILLPDLPYPITAGGQMRMAPVVRILARLSDLHCIIQGDVLPDETAAWIRELPAEVQCISNRSRTIVHKIIYRLQILFAANNLHYTRFEACRYRMVIESLRPDLIWLETPYSIRYVMQFVNKVPVIVDYWGLSEGNFREFLHAKGMERTKQRLYYRAALNTEKKYASQLPFLLGISSHISDKLREIAPRSTVFTMPSGMAKTIVPPEQPVPVKPYHMLMTGDFSFPPNIDGALYFMRDIFPLIRAAIPEAQIEFAGKNPDASIVALKETPGVTVSGYVPDLLETIRGCSLYVLPLRKGSGIRSKLFDVFPLGKAIALTSIAAEGLELVDGKNCRIADEPAVFASTCIALLQNRLECRRLGENAAGLVQSVYSMATMEATVTRIIKEMTGKEIT